MPDTLSLSAGVSLGLLAGIVSGVCYLVANSFPRTRSEGERRCLTSSRDDGVCRRCGGDHRGGPVPCICFTHEPVKFESGAWFLRQVQRALSVMPWSISTEKLEQIEEECDEYDNPGPSDPTRGELRKIREFLETISAKLAGGPLEGTNVAPLYDHPAYLPPPRNASPSNASTGGASGAHVQLKRLVARVVEEAASLPALARYAAEPQTPTLESSTYEDLLASAILNKVIERYQNENGSGGRSSGIHSASASPTPSERSSPRSLNSRHTRDITPPLHEEDDVSDWEEGEATDEALEMPRRVPFPEFGGDIVHNTDNEDREFDEVSGSDLQAVDGTWEENWLFQKKKIKTIQSVPVPMLVPNSNTEYRALIGDRDADDTTDLSDNASDSEEQAADYKSDMKKVLDSKHVIGGIPKVEDSDFEPDSLTILDGEDEFEQLVDKMQDDKTVDAIINEINDNVTIVETVNVNAKDQVDGKLVLGIDSGPLTKAEFAVKEEIHRTLLNGNVEELESIHAKTNGDLHNGEPDSLQNVDNFNNNKDSMNTLSHHEREGEYEETVTVPVQRYADSLRRKHFDDRPQVVPTRDTDQDDELIPGSIAYRERKKWLNYVEMPNNPYSPEAIQKRLSTKSTSSLFDMFTNKKEDDDDKIVIPDDESDERESNEVPSKEINHNKLTLAISNDSINNIDRIKSPSPRILKDVVADEIPQYKRYGRDYYIREAKSSCGGRKKTSTSDTSSVSSMNKSTSLDNFDTEFTSPVSASSSLSDLEASALHQNIVRAVLSPRNASPNFAINPIFENPDRQIDNADENHATDDRVGRNANGLLIKQFNMIATNQHYTKFAGKEDMTSLTTTINNKDDIMIEYDDANDQTLFAATPIYLDDDTDKKFEEILETVNKSAPSEPPPPIPVEVEESEPLKSPISVDNSYISTSSMEDSIKIYNVQTGEIIKCKPEDNVSVRYEPDANDNIDIVDKNISEVDSVSSGNDVHDAVLDDTVAKLEFESDDILQHLPKVKELAKKFVSMENLEEPVKTPQPYLRRRRSKDNILADSNFKPEKAKQMYMHSLTARSISKEFRDELKLSMSTPLTVPGGSKEIPEGIEEVTKESSRPGSPLPEPGTIKTKLAFFESLKSKFSSK
ncbi:myosin-7a binding protein isoform X2 [Anticarsia gemmatalis]|uniref:myosin-7a binding protein isoform X2 n=1 Tax=Anticarsia gemmatalis TaxID=129554 RepID=UPI003F75CB86